INQYKDQHVLVLGGGDSAVDWALMLEPIAKEVTLAHRRNTFRAHEYSVEQLKASRDEKLTPFVASDISGEDRIKKVLLEEVSGDRQIDFDVVYELGKY